MKFMKFMKFLEEYGMYILVVATILAISGAFIVPLFVRMARDMWRYALN